MSTLRELSRPALLAVADALDRGAPIHEILPADLAERVEAEIGSRPHVAWALRELAAERLERQEIADRCELVWSADDGPGRGTRSTALVVMDLFAEAREYVLIATYALDGGDKAQSLFGALARRMDADGQLAVRLFANVARHHSDERSDAVLLKEFGDRLRDSIWPGSRLPDVYYDPRALRVGAHRACLHAKCVVVDGEAAFVTSANFTEAAHERNIEAGVLVRDPGFARSLTAQFDRFVAQARFLRLPS